MTELTDIIANTQPTLQRKPTNSPDYKTPKQEYFDKRIYTPYTVRR